MPHFLASNISLPSLPYMQEDFTFVYEAIKCNDANQSLILVEYKQNAFFLRKQKRATKNNSILKCEKSSAKVHTGVIKNALKILSKHQDSLISHNLNNNSPRQNLQLPYFKPIEFFLDFRPGDCRAWRYSRPPPWKAPAPCRYPRSWRRGR